MSLQLLQEINNTYHMAILLHRSMADLYWFIYMPGYAMLHEYQYLSESLTQRKLKRYITSTYHTIVPDKIPQTANIIEPLIGDKNRKSLKPDDTWRAIKESFRIYLKWEESALKQYQRTSAELFSSGEIAAFNFVSDEIIKDVKTELVYITDKYIELSAHNFDMPQIVAEQPDYFERYEYLIKNLLGESEQFHHWNGALDPRSRVLFEKSPGK